MGDGEDEAGDAGDVVALGGLELADALAELRRLGAVGAGAHEERDEGGEKDDERGAEDELVVVLGQEGGFLLVGHG